MQSVEIPGTGLRASRLAFGTASLHHVIRAVDRQGLLRVALDEGFSHFDTAPIYGEGIAERALGRFLSGGLRHRVTIASKFGMSANPLFERIPVLMYAYRAFAGLNMRLGRQGIDCRMRDLSREAAEVSLAKTLRALQTDWLDILFVHEPVPGDASALEDLADWLVHQKRSGRVRYMGLAGRASECVAIARALPGVFDILQVEDSLARREADLLISAGMPLQITYGYLRQARAQVSIPEPIPVDALKVFDGALRRNSRGVVLVSTRKTSRLCDLANLAQKVDAT